MFWKKWLVPGLITTATLCMLWAVRENCDAVVALENVQDAVMTASDNLYTEPVLSGRDSLQNETGIILTGEGNARSGKEAISVVQGISRNIVLGKPETVQTPEKSVQDALNKLKQAESIQADLSLDMGINAFGLKLEALATMDMTAFRSPTKAKTDLELDLGFWGTTKLNSYLYEEDDKYHLVLQNKKNLVKQELPVTELSQYNGQKLLQIYLGQVEDIEEAGTEKLATGEAYKYTGVIRSGGLKTVLLDAGTLDIFVTLLENNKILKPLGSLLRQKQTTISEMMKKAEEIPVTIWIDKKTGYLVQCNMDIAYAMNDSLKQLTSDNSKKKTIWSNFAVTKAEMVIRCNIYNAAKDFRIPE